MLSKPWIKGKSKERGGGKEQWRVLESKSGARERRVKMERWGEEEKEEREGGRKYLPKHGKPGSKLVRLRPMLNT